MWSGALLCHFVTDILNRTNMLKQSYHSIYYTDGLRVTGFLCWFVVFGRYVVLLVIHTSDAHDF